MIETSVSDLIDRLTILNIKLANGLEVNKEIDLLNVETRKIEHLGFENYYKILFEINKCLWSLEEEKRKIKDRYSVRYSNVSELITQINDLRAKTKMQIDDYFKSTFKEQKTHRL